MMRMFGKNIRFYEDEMLIDSDETSSLVWEQPGRNPGFALSGHDDKAGNDKAEYDKALEERPTVLCETFWDDFLLLARVCLLRDEDADFYDVFETIRTKFLGGWGYTDSFTAKLDAEIELEYQKDCLKGLMTP